MAATRAKARRDTVPLRASADSGARKQNGPADEGSSGPGRQAGVGDARRSTLVRRFIRIGCRRAACVAVCLILDSVALADTQNELWPEANAFLKLDARFRVYLHSRLT